MSRAAWLLVAIGLLRGPGALAQPSVLSAVDDLRQSGNCEAALGLLDHAEGTVAELAGRRALCEARMGRASEAAAHTATALASPADPWVLAHRADLLAALSAGASASSSVLGTATSGGTPPDGGSAPPPPAQTSRAEAHLPDRFVQEFGNDVPEDRPLARIRPMVDGVRLVFRGLVGVGFSWRNRHAMSYPGGSFDVPAPAGLQASGYIDSTGASSLARKTTFPFVIGGQGELRLANRFAIITEATIRIDFGSTEGSYRAVVGQPHGFYGSGFYPGDVSRGAMHYRSRWGVDATVALRVPLARDRLFIDLGAQVSGSHQRGSAKLYDPGTGVAGDIHDDSDSRAPGTYEGRITQRLGDFVAAGVFDIGGYVGRRRDYTWTTRIIGGPPYVDLHLLIGIPLWSSEP